MKAVPAGWEHTVLSKVVELQRGFDLPHHRRVPGRYPVLTSGETGGTHSEGPVKGPGFVVGRATNLGKPKWSDTDYWPHNTTMFAKDFLGNDPRWLFHLFESTDLTGFDSGSVQPMLNRNYISAVPVLKPPLAEQQAIAEVLGALDDKIAANTALAGKATSTIAAGYTVAMSDGFVERPLLQTLTVEFGESFGGKLFSAPGVGRPLIRIRDLRTFESQVWTTETRPSEVVVAPGDVLVGMDAEFRATQWLGDSGLMNQRVLRASHPTYGQALVREVLKKPLAEIENEKSATTVIHLNKSDLARKTVYLPTPASISAFEATAEPLYELCVALAAENRTLAATRDALLPQLMSGRLRIRDAEAMVSTVGATIRTGANDEC